MKPTTEMLNSPAFQYAEKVKNGQIKTGQKIKLAVERFYKWIADAPESGFHLDHKKGMLILHFFATFINHTTGAMAGQPFILQPFQAFTMYNLFGWIHTQTGNRRIRTVYDKRAKKNGKTAEMAGLALYCMSIDFEMEAQIYVGATKEAQAKLCWQQARQFIESPVANKKLKQMGFRCLQTEIQFKRTGSTMRALGGDSKTQDGINSHLSIIDEYHAHATDGVKENLESSSVNRTQPITYHITTAGVNLSGVCKNYEDAVTEVLEGTKTDEYLWIMIHDLDEGDDYENEENWYKANPLLGSGLKIESIRVEFIKAMNQPSKIPNFKTKHLNMWVDAPQVWIPEEIWMRNKVNEIPMHKFQEYGSYAGLDLSTTIDITVFLAISEPDEDQNRYIKTFFFCPEEMIKHKSKEDRVPYDLWVKQGYITAIPGTTIDYEIVENVITQNYNQLNITRIEADKWNCESMAQNLTKKGLNITYFGQDIGNISFPTKQFEKLVYEGKIKHDGNPVLKWMLAGCVIVRDPNDNIKVHKGKSNTGGRRIDGIVAAIMALGGSLSPDEPTDKYATPQEEIYV
ncbi:terminase large subunit [Myroides sp. JBRI-B21084]|uniref:terminase large subunit n=1 Tax=Myroides sp. JBRI-B21084 TaxID=3119977 RepID=UPI0026E3521B|nr:terminase TerL endonuclease subunit [Paenimyroides cloacae]WKW47280.1 terminase large subunit [Paenimyroides cloacae]